MTESLQDEVRHTIRGAQSAAVNRRTVETMAHTLRPVLQAISGQTRQMLSFEQRFDSHQEAADWCAIGRSACPA
jgi:hypothetical protein